MGTKKYKVIGMRLQDARLKKGWTLDEVQLKLQISKRYLMALEAGEDDDLPGDYYTQSLIKQYANLLGVEVGNRHLENEPESIKEWRRTHGEVTSRAQKELQQKPSVLSGLIHQHPWLMGIILVGVIWLLVWAAFSEMADRYPSQLVAQKNPTVIDKTKKSHHKTNASKTKSTHPSAKKQSKQTTTKPKIEKVNDSADNLRVTLPDEQKHATLKLKTGDNQSWNSLTATAPQAATVAQGVMEAHQTQHFKLKKGYTYVLKIGNTIGLKGSIGGRKMPDPATGVTVRSVTIVVN
ncbi:helix-turn-helix domain-containing protein [Pediococcus acidilactici]|uniref:helix-turn-helix domain-containing protein n=1 Tax=Pediococcus acidilactici TaxID=1254 RepID=UPI003CEE6992